MIQVFFLNSSGIVNLIFVFVFVFVFDFVFVFVFDFVLENIFCLMKKNDKYCLSD